MGLETAKVRRRNATASSEFSPSASSGLERFGELSALSLSKRPVETVANEFTAAERTGESRQIRLNQSKSGQKMGLFALNP
jgi:hypothetical protein